MNDQWNELIRDGWFSEEIGEYLSEDIDAPRSITHMDATYHGDGWTITVDHDDDLRTEYTIDDQELPDWWWEDLYDWADEIGAEWELNYEDAT